MVKSFWVLNVLSEINFKIVGINFWKEYYERNK